MLRLLTDEERKNAICACCGETCSVKYEVDLVNPETGEPTGEKVTMCNRCALELTLTEEE